jgi:hypothetical protein
VDKWPRAAPKWSVRLTAVELCSSTRRKDDSVAGGGGPRGGTRDGVEPLMSGGSGGHGGRLVGHRGAGSRGEGHRGGTDPGSEAAGTDEAPRRNEEAGVRQFGGGTGQLQETDNDSRRWCSRKQTSGTRGRRLGVAQR